MTLENLVGRSLEAIEPDASMVQKLLQASEACLNDALIKELSNENRFDIAYKSVMQLANVALLANGFRTLTSKPGHHQTMIQTLPTSVGLETGKMIELDALRKKRNVTDYSGDLVSDKEVEACIALAKELSLLVNMWIRENHSDLLG